MSSARLGDSHGSDCPPLRRPEGRDYQVGGPHLPVVPTASSHAFYHKRQTWVGAAVAAAAMSKLDAVSRELGAIPPVAAENPQPFRNGPADPSSAASKWQVALSRAR